MIAGDLEIKSVLQICGFLGNFYGRAIFIVYCGVNMLVFNSGGLVDVVNTISNICGWVCIGFGFVLACLKCCSKSDSLLNQELETYLAKQKGTPDEGKTTA